jgi:hypothetical protein
MNETMFLEIFFEVLNIIIASVIGVYIFRKHILPSLKKEMQAAADYVLNLIQSKKDTRDQSAILDQNIVDDHEYGQYLLKNIERWSAVIERKHEEHAVELARKEAALKERIALQEQTLHMQDLYHKAGSELVEQVQVECANLYQDNKAADAFMKNIFDQLKRESS